MNPFKPLKAALLLSTGALLLFSACSKQDDLAPQKLNHGNEIAQIIPNWQTVTLSNNGSQGTITNNNGIYLVENFRQTGGMNFFWDFSENDAATAASFDIKFTGLNTGDITSNDSIRFVDVDFTSVVSSDWASGTAPQPTPAGSNVFGMNQVVGSAPPFVTAFANGAGWYIYIWSTHIAEPVADRTFLWKRGTELYKFEIISIYQNQVLGGNFAYYTFRYQQL